MITLRFPFIFLLKRQCILIFKELPAEVFWKSDTQQRKLSVVYEEIINDMYFAMNEQKVNNNRLTKYVIDI